MKYICYFVAMFFGKSESVQFYPQRTPLLLLFLFSTIPLILIIAANKVNLFRVLHLFRLWRQKNT